MTSSKRQKRNVLIAACIVFILFIAYAVYQTVPFETEWRFAPYEDGYMLLEYTQAIQDKTQEIQIPAQHEEKDVVAIDDKVFYKNKKITKVIIPDAVTELGASVFKGCKNLVSVEFGNNLQTMGGECFKDCRSLTEVVLPDSLTEIRGEAFMGCSALKSVTLPKNITEIRGNTFENCTSLEFVEIPVGVTRIAAHAFYGCSSLSGVFVPDTVKEIGSSAFRRCPKLEKIELPEGVAINERAFKESPTRLLKKQIPDDLLDDIISEVQSTNCEVLYVIYDEAKGPDEIVAGNESICIVDSIRYEEILKEGFALREFTEKEELVAYLEEAKKKGAQHVAYGFYSEIGSEKVGYPYFVNSSGEIDDLIADFQTPEEADNPAAEFETYDVVPEAQIDTNIGAAAAFDMGDIETYEAPDAATADSSGLQAAESIGE